MSVPPSNGRGQPLRILLVSDDDRFAQQLATAAASRELVVDRASKSDDLDMAVLRTAPHVVVFDADVALRRAVRAATALADLHPGVAIVLVALDAGATSISGLPLVEKRRSAARLLGEAERAYLGIRA